MTHNEVIVIGAGQAGLAAAWHLQQQGIDFAIVDGSDKIGGSWLHYYENLVLFSPARFSSLPGMPFPGEPDHYPTRDEVMIYLSDYAGRFGFPVELGQNVVRVETGNPFHRLEMSDGSERTAHSIVVASGGFNAPSFPSINGQSDFAGQILHSSAYRTPQQFSGKRVIVVGAGNSAVQIAVELDQHADVTLAVRERIRFIPQRIFGRDFHWWLTKLRLDNSLLFSDHGVPVMDDGRYRKALRAGRPVTKKMFKTFQKNSVLWDDGESEPIDTVIFATGFKPSLGFLANTGALDSQGEPFHKVGVSTTVPRLGYVGLSGQTGLASATLRGVGRDAALVIPQIIDAAAEIGQMAGAI